MMGTHRQREKTDQEGISPEFLSRDHLRAKNPQKSKLKGESWGKSLRQENRDPKDHLFSRKLTKNKGKKSGGESSFTP